jgi:hypothetical protein
MRLEEMRCFFSRSVLSSLGVSFSVSVLDWDTNNEHTIVSCGAEILYK